MLLPVPIKANQYPNTYNGFKFYLTNKLVLQLIYWLYI